MPPFRPNVEKMKKKKDIEGLIEALKNEDPEIRVEAAEALKNIGEPTAIEPLTKILVNALRFGNDDDKIEAMIIMQGYGVEYVWADRRIRKKVQKKLPLDVVRSALLEVAERDSYPLVRWHALVTLAELGGRNDQILDQLIRISETLMTALENPSMPAFGIRSGTLRALSFFRNNSIAVNAVVNALKGSFLLYKQVELPLKEEFYALGDPSTRELLEFWSTKLTHGREVIRKSARVALELFGVATFDEIR